MSGKREDVPNELEEHPKKGEPLEKVRARHPHYRDAFDRAWSLATLGHTSKVIIVAGPTGVGKSTLGASLQKKALLTCQDECAADPSIVPSVLVKAVAPHGRGFNWKDFYIRTLEELREPLIERKVWSPQQLSLLGGDVVGKTSADGLYTELLRRSLERAFKRRKTKYFIVDEAHHILLCTDQRHLALQFESLKSLADMCNATLVLLGTYKLLMIRDYSAQLTRRSQIVHFPPYRMDDSDDRGAFKSVLARFKKSLAVPLEAGLAENVEFFFLKTAGCVGILRDLLLDAQCEAIDRKLPHIDSALIERVAQPNKAIKTILQEAAIGALALEDISLDDVKMLAGMTPAQVVAHRLNEINVEMIEGKPSVPGAAPDSKKRSSRPVGQRAPARDKVGGGSRVPFL